LTDRLGETGRVPVAPDSFKGTFTAGEVARAMRHGVEAAGLIADECPVADGGEGTMDVLLDARGGSTRELIIGGPLGDLVEAKFAVLPGGVAVVESAQASGLALIDPDRLNAEAATTRGTGELVVAAIDQGVDSVLICAGGTAATDGGRGAIEAIEEAGGTRGVTLEVLCDVQTPWERAAEVFAPQKGADRAAVKRLANRLDALADRLPRDPRSVPMTGCAGGLAGGLWAQYNATLSAGAEAVLTAVRFDERLAGARFVLTGEGRLDEQSLMGKLVGTVTARAHGAGIGVHAIVGVDASGPRHRAAGMRSVTEARTLDEIVLAARRLAAAQRASALA
jgi:glycerate 2-kinase